MRTFPSISELIRKMKWKDLMKIFLPVTIAVGCSFKEAMKVVKGILDETSRVSDQNWNLFAKDYCVNLMRMLRIKYPQEWQRDWKNEAFLGVTCEFVYRYEEGYKYIKNAFDQHSDPPQSLILALIMAGQYPEVDVDDEFIDKLILRACKKGLTVQSAQLRSSLAQKKGDTEGTAFWLEKVWEAEEKGLYASTIVPEAMENE